MLVAFSLRYTCISDFQVSPDSVKLVLGSGDNCLRCFVENVFEKKSTKFNLNRLSFMNVMVKTFLMCFYARQCSLFAPSYKICSYEDTKWHANSKERSDGYLCADYVHHIHYHYVRWACRPI
jgi:hypothetical protein